MIGDKRRLLTDAMVKARVLARRAMEKHALAFASQQEVIQMQMMEMMKNGKPAEQPVLQNPERQ